MYTGRFAPSPTGPLHFGSLVAALASWLDARASQGKWLVRIEDLDRARSRLSMADAILRQLDAIGLGWDGPVTYQSARLDRYRSALDALERDGRVYWCCCSRREIADSATRFSGAVRFEGAALAYPGTCRNGMRSGGRPRAMRLRTTSGLVRFADRLQGTIEQDVEREVGDFVVLRADGMFAYQLAVVVDDAEQGVTDVVRGADLLDSTPRQIVLQRLLGLAQPRYLHLPVAVDRHGAKLSKQTAAEAIAAPAASLRSALGFLGMPGAPAAARVDELLGWALQQWQQRNIRAVRSAPAPA
jgi:glutamyl-Q tRNA(Asp) synthetase